MLNTLFRDHPFNTVRTAELQRWGNSEAYEGILRGITPDAARKAISRWRTTTPLRQGITAHGPVPSYRSSSTWRSVRATPSGMRSGGGLATQGESESSGNSG